MSDEQEHQEHQEHHEAGAPMNLIPKVPVQPVPTFIEIGGAESPNGETYVLIAFSTPMGLSAFHVNTKAVDALCEALQAAKTELTKARLIVAEISPESIREINEQVLGRRPAQEGARP